jgi:hypothetical protein
MSSVTSHHIQRQNVFLTFLSPLPHVCILTFLLLRHLIVLVCMTRSSPHFIVGCPTREATPGVYTLLRKMCVHVDISSSQGLIHYRHKFFFFFGNGVK